jgi:hypothetical protein
MREGALRFISGAAPMWTQTSEDSVVVKVVMFLWVGRIGRLAHGPAIDASARDNVDADVRRSGHL